MKMLLSGELDSEPYPGGGDTPLYDLYGDVPLDRVWFFGLSVLNRLCNFMRVCPKQGLNKRVTMPKMAWSHVCCR